MLGQHKPNEKNEKLLLEIKLLRNESQEVVSSASCNEFYRFTAIDTIFGFNSFNPHFGTMN